MMRFIKIIFISSVFLIGITTNAGATSQESEKKLPHISPQKAYALFLQKKIILIDVHPGGPEKKQAEILGARYLPFQVLAKRKVKLPRNIIIGVFCR